jgi:hypothetical protein
MEVKKPPTSSPVDSQDVIENANTKSVNNKSNNEIFLTIISSK